MARGGRLAGGLWLAPRLHGELAWVLVGDTKVPCDWQKSGFKPPPARDVVRDRFIQLEPCATPTLTGTTLSVELEGVEVARMIGERLTVNRNGSVSERLWSLILGEDEVEAPTGKTIPCAWLCEMPTAVWDVVREAVLKCT